MNEPTPIAPPPASPADDFRDHLTTADREGHRQWLYPKQPQGPFTTARTYLSYCLLLVLFAGPFLRIHGNPLLLLNVVERRFVILGAIFWPQDAAIFAIATLLFLTGIIVFTAAFGRLWCGWTCPQTLLMEMVFRRLEVWIEGDALARKALDRAPWTAGKVWRKGLKHLVFLGLSWLVGNTLLAYLIGSDKLFALVTDNPRHHLQGLSFMILFTLLFYGIFARFREQACTFICPYGRFQSTLLDENSIVVAYNPKRGERRGRWRRDQGLEQRQAAGHGDCIDCQQCVAVCPTGIDIRDGTQMECVHCTACIDACNAVMRRLRRPPGLISYASLNSLERGEGLRPTPRLVGYSCLLLALAGLLAFLLLTRSEVDATFFRAPGALFQRTPEGSLNNLYLLKLVNKTSRALPIELRLENLPGTIAIMAGKLVVPPEALAESPVLVTLAAQKVGAPETPLVVGIYSGNQRLDTLKSVFIGPDLSAPSP